MKRYIDAYALENRVEDFEKLTGMKLDIVHDFVSSQPTADVRENVKAHWIDMKPTGDSRFMCSRCKGKEKVPTIMGEPIVWDYCPNCGAEMQKGEDDE